MSVFGNHTKGLYVGNETGRRSSLFDLVIVTKTSFQSHVTKAHFFRITNRISHEHDEDIDLPGY